MNPPPFFVLHPQHLPQPSPDPKPEPLKLLRRNTAPKDDQDGESEEQGDAETNPKRCLRAARGGSASRPSPLGNWKTGMANMVLMRVGAAVLVGHMEMDMVCIPGPVQVGAERRDRIVSYHIISCDGGSGEEDGSNPGKGSAGCSSHPCLLLDLATVSPTAMSTSVQRGKRSGAPAGSPGTWGG
ncbi:hypothetical protein MKZ38_004409 [Zalerion maritima]|uniref:Uncharacterized protein n=1 Tax=Zalerion maritima TaxID=339359 RepID=A0AAD5WR17_9PEZI|nr:hypothetical protein MKZ38_004409 [Zalerion maritima]